MSATLSIGSSGEDVRECQSLLVEAGFPTSVDGVFGPATEKAVKEFQSSRSLKADGVVGNKTWAALREEAPPSVESPIDFQKVADLFPQMMPQRYTLHDAQCPSNPPGVTLKNIGNDRTNCVQFTSWLLAYSFSGVRFSGDQWKLWMVGGDLQGKPPIVPNWGPKVVLDWGVATTSPGKGAYLVQYFTSTGGHSLIVVDYDPETDRVLTLEANEAIGGAGWNEIGPLRLVENPGLKWKKMVTQTWKGRFETKVAVHIARLEIDPESIQTWLAKG